MTTARIAPCFIVFEGLDGAGKSTCAKALAHTLGALYMTTPPPAIRDCRQTILDSFEGSQEAAQLFYLATVFAASRQVAEAMAAGKSVVMDRYFLSTQAYAEFRSSSLALDALGGALVPASLTVYLDVPLAERKNRLGIRHCSDADRETLTTAADARLRALYQQKSALAVSGRWLRLAISDESTGAIVERVIREIGVGEAP